ncbi:MAG: hypothetical protein RIQ81_37, partial [Pseudomonadota bacterium]
MIESWMVLLKIYILSMETAGPARFPRRLALLLALALTASCASAGGRKRSVLNQSNQSVEGDF